MDNPKLIAQIIGFVGTVFIIIGMISDSLSLLSVIIGITRLDILSKAPPAQQKRP